MSTVSSDKIPLPSNRLTAETASQHLSDHLKKTAQFIKILDVLIFGFSCLVFLLTLWLIGSIVDHWLMPIPRSVRWALWMSVAVAFSWGTFSYLLPLLVRRINPAYAAHRIEQLVPEFKNGLISWLELQSRPDLAVPKGIMAAIGYRACRFIGVQDPSATVDTGPLIKRVGIALGLIVGLAVYAMLSPKSLIESGKRLLLPWRDIPVPTRVQILAVNPGNVELTQGTPLNVEVDLRGLSANDSVVLRFNSLDGQLVNQRVSLQAAVDRVRYVGQVLTGPYGIDHEILYWIESGDATSGPYEVHLNPLPSLTVRKVQVDFPKYTRLDSREFPPNTPIEALEGSLMRVWGTANQQLERAKLVLNPELNQQGAIVQASEYLDMQLGQKDVSGVSKLSVQHKSFCLRGYNLLGDSNVHPVIVPMTVYPDVPPEITLVGPEDRTVRVGQSSRLTLEVRASDVDFGLSKVQLEIRVGAGPASTKVLLEDAHLQEKPLLSTILTCPLDVSSLNARIGDRVRIVATAFDNRHDPITDQFSPNQRQSQPLILEVVPPAESRIPPELEQKGDAETGREDQEQTKPDQFDPPKPPPRQPEAAPPSADQSPSGQNGAGQSADGDTPPSAQDDSSGSQSGSGSSGREEKAGDQSKAEPTGGSGSDSQPDSKSTGDQSSADGGQASDGKPSPDGGQNTSRDSTGEGADDRDEETLQKIRDFMERTGQLGQTGQRPDEAKSDSGVSSSEASSEQPSDSRQPSTDESTESGTEKSETDRFDTDKSDTGKSDADKFDTDKSDTGESESAKAESEKTESEKVESSEPRDESSEAAEQDSSQRSSSDSDNGQAKGDQQSSDQRAGDKEANDEQSSDQQSSDQQSSDEQSSDEQSSDQQSSQQPSGEQPSSEQESSEQQSAEQQSGDQPSGDQSSKGQESKSPEASSGSEDAASDGSGASPASQPGASGSEAGQQASDSQDSDSTKASDSSDAAPGRGSSGGSSPGPGMGSTADGTGTASDPSLAEEATDLALEYLERQREQPDPDLLKELDWTAEDLRSFIDRYQTARKLSGQAEPLDPSDLDMKRLQLETRQAPAIGPSGQADDYRQQLDSGGRVRPPERLRRQIEQFQKALQQGK